MVCEQMHVFTQVVVCVLFRVYPVGLTGIHVDSVQLQCECVCAGVHVCSVCVFFSGKLALGSVFHTVSISGSPAGIHAAF